MPTSPLDICIRRKVEAKKVFAAKFAFSVKRPLLGIILDNELSDEEENRLTHILEGTAHVDVQVVILADTNLDVCGIPHTIVVPYSRINRKELLEAADMSLGFSFSDVEEMLLNGTIPISSSRPEVSDYNPNRETGNGFIYKKSDHWSVFAALVRALETYKFPYDWKNIVRQGIKES